MNKPLTDIDILMHKNEADGLAHEPCYSCRQSGKRITSLIAEIERLQAREADLVADIHLLGDLAIEMTRLMANAGLSAAAADFARQLEERHGYRQD